MPENDAQHAIPETALSDNTPTKRLDQVAPAVRPPQVEKKPVGPMIAFIVVAVLAVVAMGILVLVLVSRGIIGSPGGQPVPTGTSPGPSSSVSAPARSAAPAPATPAPSLSTFEAQDSYRGCSFGGHGRHANDQGIQVSWATENTTAVWIAPGDSDAADANYMQVPTSGDQRDFSRPMEFNCAQPTNTYTITLVGADGQHVSRSWTVSRKGGRF